MGATASNKRYGKPRKNTKSPYGDGFLGFVDIALSDADKTAIEEMAGDAGKPFDAFLVQVVEDGYKFSLVADPEHNSYIATLTGRHEGCENKGYALSARGPDPHGAVVALWYKHGTLANWGAWAEQGTVADGQLPLWQ